jgi:hypothetical protein
MLCRLLCCSEVVRFGWQDLISWVAVSVNFVKTVTYSYVLAWPRAVFSVSFRLKLVRVSSVTTTMLSHLWLVHHAHMSAALCLLSTKLIKIIDAVRLSLQAQARYELVCAPLVSC